MPYMARPVMAPLRPIMQVLVTLAVLAVAFYVILDPGVAPDTQKWAMGTIGTLLGFWLRGQ
jgi:hypothetical protein